MKNDDEMYQSVLSRWNEYQEKKKQRIRMMKRTVPILACFFVVVMFGLDGWERLEKLPSIPAQPEVIDEPTTENFETDSTFETIATTAPVQSDETDIVTTTAIPQTQTLTTVAVSNTETQALVTSIPATGTASMTEIQTIVPIQTTVVIEPEPITEIPEPVAITDNVLTTAPVIDTQPMTEIQTTAPVDVTEISTIATVINTQSTTEIQTTAPIDVTEISTTATVINTQPTTEIQTTVPVVTTVETSASIVTETEPISTTSDNPIEEPILEPIDFPAHPLSFHEFADVVDAIRQNDVSSYDEPYQETYRKMFDRFASDGFIYQPITTDLISLKTDRMIVLYPYAKYEDIGIQYFLTYKGNSYRVKFYCADTAIVSETNGIAEYVQKRMGRMSDKIIVVNNQTMSELIASDGSQICVSAFIDECHYCDVASSATEEEMIEFLDLFYYEQIPLQ